MSTRRELPNKIDLPRAVITGYLTLNKRLTEAKRAPVPATVEQAYGVHKSAIEEVYGSTAMRTDRLFHGTGSLQYEMTPEGTYTGEVVDILDSVISNGIQTRTDWWLATPGKADTISLSKARFYSRSYALLYESEDVPLEWQYGSKGDWGMYFGMDTTLGMSPGEMLTMAYTVGKTHYGSKKALSGWYKKIKNDITPDTRYASLADALSTIEGNFPVIAVFADEEVPTYDVPGFRRYEDRTLFNLSPDKMLALEVPLSQVAKVTQKVRQSGLNIHVLPIECVDLHASKFPTEQHTKGQRNVSVEKRFKTGEKQRMRLSEADYSAVPQGMMEIAGGDMGQGYHPQHVLEALGQSAFLSEQYGQIVNWEGQTLYYNTLSTMLEHEKSFGHMEELPGGIRKEFYRLFLAVHDIGKPMAKAYGSSQHRYNEFIGVNVLQASGATPSELTLASVLLSQENPVGELLKKYGTVLHLGEKSSTLGSLTRRSSFQDRLAARIAQTQEKISAMAESTGMSYSDMFQLLLMYNHADAASYTSEGGSVGSLNYAFEQRGTKREYSPIMRRLIEEVAHAA